MDKCDMCDSEMMKVNERTLGDTIYDIIRCDKCNRHIIRRQE